MSARRHGCTALVIGPFQFLSGLRARRPAFHRLLGRAYLLCVLISGLGTLFLASVSPNSFIAQTGFGMLGTLWLISGFSAYRAIRQGQMQLHRPWMTRNYALTFGAVCLRLWLLIGNIVVAPHISQTFAVPQETLSTDTQVNAIAAWFSWILPLVVAEWFIVRPPVTRTNRAGVRESGAVAAEANTRSVMWYRADSSHNGQAVAFCRPLR